MGNQPSKDKATGSSRSSISAEGSGPSLDSYPSFSKSDTRESARSFRGSIRSKIPGSSRVESPRTSISTLTGGLLDEDSSSAEKEEADVPSKPSLLRPSVSAPSSDSGRQSGAEDVSDNPSRPPSPSQSASLGHGHSHINEAQQSGEVGNVSDQPPSAAAAAAHPSHLQKAGESILVKKEYINPKPRAKSKTRHLSADASMELGTLKTIDLDDMIQRLLDAGYAGKVTKTLCLKNAEINAICIACRDVFLSQPPLLELTPPVKIVGDIHGQYTDLLRLFEMCGFPPAANYLFLGDYVDRGKQSLETILLLLCYKLKFPENFFLLRGNHESANVTRIYGFYDECKRRTNVKVWKAFVDTFNTLPIAAIVAGKIFCVHGGLSPALTHMDDIRQIARPTDVPDYGLLNDLLWSDPAEIDTDWEPSERGVSYCFGKRVIMNFLQKHDFDLVCRAHMVVEDGYEFFNDRILVTVFSAPNVSTPKMTSL